jgi:hypothetical protein
MDSILLFFIDPGEMVFNFTPVPSAEATGQAGQAVLTRRRLSFRLR